MNILQRIGLQSVKPEIKMVEEDFSTWALSPARAKYNKSLPSEHLTGRYVYYGPDNLFPNRLNELYEASPIHSSIIDFKKSMICGAGYTIEIEGDDLKNKIKVKQIENYVYDDSNLSDFISEITMDYLIHSVIYLKLVWNNSFTDTIAVERIEPSKIRVGVNPKDREKVDKFFYSYDWTNTGQFPIQEFPAYKRNSKNKVEILRIIKKSVNTKWYSYPQYASACNWIELDARISVFHKSNIENSNNPSKMLVFTEKPGSPEAKRAIIQNFKDSFTGEETTGKTFIFFANGKDNIPQYTTVQPASLDKQFEQTAEQALRNICYGHQINPIVLGLKTSTSLGNPKELMNAYNIFKNVVITPYQSDINKLLNRILELKGIPATITLNEVKLDLQE